MTSTYYNIEFQRDKHLLLPFVVLQAIAGTSHEII